LGPSPAPDGVLPSTLTTPPVAAKAIATIAPAIAMASHDSVARRVSVAASGAPSVRLMRAA